MMKKSRIQKHKVAMVHNYYVHMDNKDNRKLHIDLDIKFIAALFILSNLDVIKMSIN